MRYIAHRGNLEGPKTELENMPAYIELALEVCDVEIDLWVVEGKFYLGHDEPTYAINSEWLDKYIDKLWIHCKNIEAVEKLFESDFNFFWHETDTITLTNHGFIWAYPGKQPIKNSIAVMPERHNDDVSNCYGICTDYVFKYQKLNQR
jgi:hypothetical protein